MAAMTTTAATKTGIAAMEEATYLGVSVNATVSFTVPQALAAAEVEGTAGGGLVTAMEATPAICAGTTFMTTLLG